MLHLQETANSSRVQGFLHQRLAALVLPRNPEAPHSGCSVECAQRRFRFLGRRSICRPCCRFSLSTHCGGACRHGMPPLQRSPPVALCHWVPCGVPCLSHQVPTLPSSPRLLQQRTTALAPSGAPTFHLLPSCLPACLHCQHAACAMHALLAGSRCVLARSVSSSCLSASARCLLHTRMPFKAPFPRQAALVHCVPIAPKVSSSYRPWKPKPCCVCCERSLLVPPRVSLLRRCVTFRSTGVQGWRDNWDDWQEREEHRGKKGRAGTRCGLQGE